MTLPLHFVSIGEFKYPHMCSVASAAKVHPNNIINLWYIGTPPFGKYFDAISGMVELKEYPCKDYPAYRNLDPKSIVGAQKDEAEWNILYENGGIFLDLDTFCIKEIASLNNHREFFASLDVKDHNSIAFPFNNAIVSVERPAHPILERILVHSMGKLNQSISWGDTGPIVLSTVLLTYCSNLKSWEYIVPHEVLCPYGGNEVGIYYEENENLHEPATFPDDTRAFHLYAKASGARFDNVNANWVRYSSSLYARTIKEYLPESIWGVEAPYNVESYLNNRGRHYKALLDVCKHASKERFRIFEFGTCYGETAHAMIKLVGENIGEENIEYTGIDLFSETLSDTRDVEASGGYVSPSEDAIYSYLERSTKAKINLISQNSRHFVNSGKKYDLIYIDGGHSLNTIASDWSNAKLMMGPDTIVVFDDYFDEIPWIGCKVLIDGLKKDDRYDVNMSIECDDYVHPFGRLRTRLATVTHRNV